MTAAVYRSSPSLSVPPSQNTAPVLEFNCLYTHDVRKKAKKWQDGVLRYHTFNKRVMVYDVPRNYVGDAHWTGHDAVQLGDELTLDQGVVMVEVGDGIGQTETDLTELRKSRKKGSTDDREATSRKAAAFPARGNNGHVMTPGGTAITLQPRACPQPKHRSLNALLGASKGPLGKAQLPQQSPFEQRLACQEAENGERDGSRPRKRARTGTVPTHDTAQTHKAAKTSGPPRSAVSSGKRAERALQTRQPCARTEELIELSDDEEHDDALPLFLPGLSSAAPAPCSSPAKHTIEDLRKQSIESSSPAFQTQSSVRDHKLDTERIGKDMHCARPVPRSQNVTAQPLALESARASSVRQQSISGGLTTSIDGQKESPVSKPWTSKASKEKHQILRLATSVPKGKKLLLCQSQLTKRSHRSSVTGACENSNAEDDDHAGRPRPRRKTLNKRSVEVDEKHGYTSIKPISAEPPTPDVVESDHNERSMLPPAAPLSRPKESSEVVPDQPISPRPQSPITVTPLCRKEQELTRTLSESSAILATISRRVPGAPVHYTRTPSPTKQVRKSAPTSVQPGPPTRNSAETCAATSETGRPRKSLKKRVSLNITTSGTSAVLLSKPFQAPNNPTKATEFEQPKDLGPWSREAFDLFTWRPPNWDDEKWCVVDAAIKTK